MGNNKKDEGFVQFTVNCPKRNLKAAVALLSDMGATATDPALTACAAKRVEKMMGNRKEKRKEEYAPEFWDADNEFLQRLRDAYADGISFTKLSRRTGLTRTTLYRYLHGEFSPKFVFAKRILDSIDEIYEEINA